jgi:hypothetical protein
MADYRCHICGAGIMIGTGAHHRCRETIESMQEKLGDRATARVIAPEPVRASRSAPSPEPESAGARATAAEEVVNAAWELVSARNLDGSLQAKPTEVSRLKAALIRYRDAPAPRAAGGTTATDPEIGALLDAMLDDAGAGNEGSVEDSRAAILAAFRTIATERADAEAERDRAWAQVDESGRVLIAAVRDRDAALARAESAEARVSELEAALQTICNLTDGGIKRAPGRSRRVTFNQIHVVAARALASRPPAATEGDEETLRRAEEVDAAHAAGVAQGYATASAERAAGRADPSREVFRLYNTCPMCGAKPAAKVECVGGCGLSLWRASAKPMCAECREGARLLDENAARLRALASSGETTPRTPQPDWAHAAMPCEACGHAFGSHDISRPGGSCLLVGGPTGGCRCPGYRPARSSGETTTAGPGPTGGEG